MTGKWTPGPWTYHAGATSYRIVGNRLKVAAEVFTSHDARLIAAAPMMVEVLQGVIHHNEATKEQYKLPESLVRHVKAALAAAEGRGDE